MSAEDGVQDLNTEPREPVVFIPDPDVPKGPWSPFDDNGQLRTAELEAEGWHRIGTMTEDGIR